jgi:16S rRNA processing protein RimM
LAAIPLSDNPERLTRVFVREAPLQIERIWRHQDALIFKFVGVDSISAAEPLEGSDVCIPREERALLPDGEYYQSDLVGCQVIEAGTERLIGVVTSWQEYGGPPLLEVLGENGKEILIPFAKSICATIDPPAKRIVVNLPEGLED